MTFSCDFQNQTDINTNISICLQFVNIRYMVFKQSKYNFQYCVCHSACVRNTGNTIHEKKKTILTFVTLFIRSCPTAQTTSCRLLCIPQMYDRWRCRRDCVAIKQHLQQFDIFYKRRILISMLLLKHIRVNRLNLPSGSGRPFLVYVFSLYITRSFHHQYSVYDYGINCSLYVTITYNILRL